MVKQTLGERLRALRLARGLSGVEMARRLGITNVYLCYLEHDKYDPSISTVARFASVFGVTLSYLLQDVELSGKARRKIERKIGYQPTRTP